MVESAQEWRERKLDMRNDFAGAAAGTIERPWEWTSNRTPSLPLSPKLTDKDVEDVIFAVRRTVAHFARKRTA